MISKILFLLFYVLGFIVLVYSILKIKELKKYRDINSTEVVFKSAIDRSNKGLVAFTILVLAWRLDILNVGMVLRVGIKAMVGSGILVYAIFTAAAVYCLLNRVVLIKSGIARFNVFNRVEHIIEWEQIVGYRWEEDCLVVDYLQGDKVNSYLWKDISLKDKRHINQILSTYIEA